MSRQPLSADHKERIKEGMRLARERKLAQQHKELHEEIQPTKETTMTTEKTPTSALMTLLESIDQQVATQIDASVTKEFAELRKVAQQNAKLEVTAGEKFNVVAGLRHKTLGTLIKVSALGLPVLLVGMAGTGKTHAAEQVAEALGLKHYTMSVGAQTSKSDIIGFMNANGGYVKTHFRTAFEEGGVFLMDEMDAGNANVLIQVNAALSNGSCAFPDAMVKKHKDFVFLASANTYGTGMNRQYVGRNQLDAATLDRFTIIEWDIDDKLEQQLAVGPQGQAWYTAVKEVRTYVSKNGIRALVTPRATQKGSRLLASGMNLREVVTGVLLGSVPEDKKADITKLAESTFGSAK